MVTIPGRDNTLGMPVFILPLDWPNGIHVSETEGGMVTIPGMPGFALEVAPGSATFPGGSREGDVSVTLVHADKVPMIPNFAQQPRMVITVQPPGVHFDPPARVTYPNLDGSAAGGTVELYAFDHDMGRFVPSGTATVSEDALTVTADAGSRIQKGGWQCAGSAAPPPSGTCEPAHARIILHQGTIRLLPGQSVDVTAVGGPSPGLFTWTLEVSGIQFQGPTTGPDLRTVTIVAPAPATSSLSLERKPTEGGTKTQSAEEIVDAILKVIFTPDEGPPDVDERRAIAPRVQIFELVNDNNFVDLLTVNGESGPLPLRRAWLAENDPYDLIARVTPDLDSVEGLGEFTWEIEGSPGATIDPPRFDAASGALRRRK
jgi:hypothetical protein